VLWLVERWQTLNVISILLWPLSLVYCILVVIRRWLYLAYILPSYSSQVQVIVVGNISVGGTGKTPFVIWLAHWLQSRGQQPGIVLRGYGGRSKQWPVEVSATSSANEVGDEAVLLAQQAKCPVVAAPDRVAAIRKLLSAHACNIVISDDGMQHYRMRRDLEIAVIDGARRYGNGLCLPAGPLREPRWRARRADMIVVNSTGEGSEPGMSIEPVYFRNIATGETAGLDHFGDSPVHALAGIGNPQRFFESLRQLGIQIKTHPFPDHHRFRKSDICPDEGGAVIMTEKDAVKCTSFVDKRHWALVVAAKPDKRIIDQLTDWLEKHLG
jgi:tetraacyldisaccharide 4'-kinase